MHDWYVFYGLDRDPFAEGGVQGLFYPGGARQETIEQLQHLARFSDCALLLCGVAGSGKTATMRHFAAQSASDTRYSLIEAALLDSPERLLTRVLEGFGMAVRGNLSLEDAVERLRVYAAERHRSGLQTWVLIDDAQHLHEDAVALLPHLLEQVGASLRLVFFCEPHFQQTLDEVLGSQNRTHVLELAPLDRGECYAYIHYRLKTAGLEAEPPFNAGEFEEIHRQSGGLPGRINALASKVLTEAVGEVQQPLSRLPVWHFGVVAITLLALLLLYLWGSMQEEAEQQPVPQLGVISRDAVDLTEQVPTLADPQELEAIGVGEEIAPPGPGSLDGTGMAPVDATLDVAVPISNEDISTAPAPAAESPAPQVASVADTQIPAAAESPATEQSFVYREGVRAGGEASADEVYLLGLESDHFLLQIMGSDDAAKVRAFAARQNMNLRQFRKLHNGREWYSLVHGDFADREAAERALRELPQSMRAASPWVRRAGAVQEEIRRARAP